MVAALGQIVVFPALVQRLIQLRPQIFTTLWMLFSLPSFCHGQGPYRRAVTPRATRRRFPHAFKPFTTDSL
jgi:hypothetical protein